MNGKIKIRHIYKATELKRFHKLEGKYHHMGKTHSGGDTKRIVFDDENGKWLALRKRHTLPASPAVSVDPVAPPSGDSPTPSFGA